MSGKNLTVISYPAQLDVLFEQVAFNANCDTASDNVFVRCQEGTSLRRHVLNTRPVTRIDLVGHGSRMHFRLGDDLVIQSSQDVPEALSRIKKLLLPNPVTIRLLGCYTGVGETGREMLRRVSDALEQEVFGTTVELYADDFDGDGLSPRVASNWLISSKSAAAVPAADRTTPSAQDKADAEAWGELQDEGYSPIGRGEPIAPVEVSVRVGETKIHLASDGHLVQIEDKADAPPLLFRWDDHTSPAPSPGRVISLLS